MGRAPLILQIIASVLAVGYIWWGFYDFSFNLGWIDWLMLAFASTLGSMAVRILYWRD